MDNNRPDIGNIGLGLGLNGLDQFGNSRDGNINQNSKIGLGESTLPRNGGRSLMESIYKGNDPKKKAIFLTKILLFLYYFKYIIYGKNQE